MSRHASAPTAVLTIRVPADLNRRLLRAARATRRTRSQVARAILSASLDGTPLVDLVAEARRQSRLASRRMSEDETLAFIAAAADLKGWR